MPPKTQGRKSGGLSSPKEKDKSGGKADQAGKLDKLWKSPSIKTRHLGKSSQTQPDPQEEGGAGGGSRYEALRGEEEDGESNPILREIMANVQKLNSSLEELKKETSDVKTDISLIRGDLGRIRDSSFHRKQGTR
ncbi:hypothetical protein GDO81_008280 [Engystomops pustulosus]|uniref:Uncharacterized protein n=1 Tax=Engystomops pustulosus TaxID=76066 RepID=A0AAV7CEQ1_ENGPU|nr:hypothetical protein GDO81_008280 [Engystomops pustulosus]